MTIVTSTESVTISDLQIRLADYMRYAEALEARIVRQEQAYRDLQSRHDRASVAYHQRLMEIEELEARIREQEKNKF